MAKKRQKAVDPTSRFPLLGQAVLRARQASEAVSSLSSQLSKELGAVRTERGRKKLLSRVEKEVRRLAQQPFVWMDISTQSDLAALRKRLRAIEKRIDGLEDSDPMKAIPEPKRPRGSEAVA